MARLDGNILRVWVDNEKDHSQTPRRPDEMPVPEREAQLTFVFRNLWQNNLGPNARITAAFVCVDEQHSILYLRFYHRFGRLPVVLYRRRREQLQKEAQTKAV